MKTVLIVGGIAVLAYVLYRSFGASGSSGSGFSLNPSTWSDPGTLIPAS